MRFLLYILAVLLVVPLILSILLWIRSYRVSDNLTLDTARNDAGKWNHLQRGLYTGPGRFVYYTRPWATYREAGHPPKTGWNLGHYAPTNPDQVFPSYSSGSGRFGFWALKDYWVVGSRAVVIPFWAPTVLCLMLGIPAFFFARRSAVKAYRRRHGLCLACGYDIRESKERCPECGLTINLRPAPSTAQ
ncbi:MAG TPA: hypothetical protein VGP99_05075 [Tepidisphaeraceae bacterium]|nr:hypothetical protein [Tepidisphaeraceae bacterium]